MYDLYVKDPLYYIPGTIIHVRVCTMMSTTTWHCRFYNHNMTLSVLQSQHDTVGSTTTTWHCRFYNHNMTLSVLQSQHDTVGSTTTTWHCRFYNHNMTLSVLQSQHDTVGSTITTWHCRFYNHNMTLSVLYTYIIVSFKATLCAKIDIFNRYRWSIFLTFHQEWN